MTVRRHLRCLAAALAVLTVPACAAHTPTTSSAGTSTPSPDAPSPSPSPSQPEGIGDGNFLVGRDTPAGTYRTVYVVRNCYWERSTSAGSIIANDMITYAPGEVTVTLGYGEAFTSKNCGRWVMDPPPPPPPPPSPPSAAEIAASKKAEAEEAKAEAKNRACIKRRDTYDATFDKLMAEQQKISDKLDKLMEHYPYDEDEYDKLMDQDEKKLDKIHELGDRPDCEPA
ncbi:hypothetical protein [Actinoplanes sp. HUAS TT8]|uniref:hypothetical protein n=1 Tax=Actinoplanes sp. HUAS TT8 TaxID=3447453 RepID=UPI003F522D02